MILYFCVWLLFVLESKPGPCIGQADTLLLTCIPRPLWWLFKQKGKLRTAVVRELGDLSSLRQSQTLSLSCCVTFSQPHFISGLQFLAVTWDRWVRPGILEIFFFFDCFLLFFSGHARDWTLDLTPVSQLLCPWATPQHTCIPYVLKAVPSHRDLVRVPRGRDLEAICCLCVKNILCEGLERWLSA